jgi:hypothetical protein
VKMLNSVPASVSAFVIASTLISGCATRVILVPDGEPVRLAEPVKARVWVIDQKGQSVKSQNRVPIPAGWYALPDPK